MLPLFNTAVHVLIWATISDSILKEASKVFPIFGGCFDLLFYNGSNSVKILIF